jgi:hypothetical protein
VNKEAIVIVLLAAVIGGVIAFFEWQAYLQAIEAVGGTPNIPAFIGWVFLAR